MCFVSVSIVIPLLSLLNMTDQTPIPVSRVVDMLNLFPLDGLRKAAQTFNLTVPTRDGVKTDQKKTLIDAIIEGLKQNTLTHSKEKVDTEKMWTECKEASEPPVRITGETVPSLDALLKMMVAVKVEKEIQNLGGIDNIECICAGKVSATTAEAEKSGLSKRWRDRYGTPEYNYTGMRRLYVDETTSTDFKARDLLALAVEQHAFEVIKRLFGHRAGTTMQFSEEPGRQSTGKTYGPQWKVFVYLAVKVKV